MIKFKVRGVEEVQAFLKTVPRGALRVALSAMAEWFIGTPQRGLKHYQPYKYVTRAQAYGQTFKSDRQRRYIMAMISEGKIDPGVPHRTGNTQRGWYANETNNGYGMNIENEQKGAYYTRDDSGQARLNALAGWRKISDIISTNIAGAIRHANAAIGNWLRKK